MVTDALCPISWRARPRSFTSLMTLYESNFIRLGWLVPGLRALRGCLRSEVAGGPALELAVVEQCRYTTTINLTYLFGDGEAAVREPGLEVRVYHDARLAEACRAGAPRWSCNMLLNKWLEYCVDSGHRFALPA
jgi:uncharacterized protein YqiB (DUF1249 family)